jgi:hypothetical protein
VCSNLGGLLFAIREDIEHKGDVGGRDCLCDHA